MTDLESKVADLVRVNEQLADERKTLEEDLLVLFNAQQPIASGVSVTPATAMNCAAVRCALLAITETLSQFPVHVYERTEDNGRERADEHPASKLLNGEANPWTPGSELIGQLTRDACLYGNGYGEITRVYGGKPQEIHPRNPETVTVKQTDRGEPVYEIAESGGRKIIIPRENVLHIKAPGFSGLVGISPVKQCREAIGLALTMELAAARLFGNGSRPSGLLSFKGKMTVESLKKAKAAWETVNSGSNSGKTAVLDNEATWEALAFNSVDSQFLQMRAFALGEIGRIYRVPPVLLLDYERQTWNNAETGGQHFLIHCLLPWIKRWEGEIRLKLFKPEERDRFYAEFMIDSILRADFAVRMEGYSKAITARIISPNEVRTKENLPPYVGGDKFENPNTTSLTITGPRDEPKPKGTLDA